MPRRRLRVAAGLLWRRGRVLLLQRHRAAKLFPRQWEFPGGKLEPGETPRRALRRELGEELTIVARIGALAAHYRHRYPNRLEVELWFFHVRRFRGRPRRPPTAERLRWVPLTRLDSYALLGADAALVAGLQALRARQPRRAA